MPLTAGLVVGGANLLGSVFSGFGANKQANAANEASQRQYDLAMQQMAAAQRAGQQAAGYIGDYGGQALGTLGQYGEQQLGALAGGQSQAANQLSAAQAASQVALQRGYGQAFNTLGSGLSQYQQAGAQARQDLMGGIGAYQQGMGQARQDLMGGLGAAQRQMAPVTGLSGYAHQAANMANQFQGQSQMQRLMSDPGGYMAQDPGYQFRLGEGMKAVERAMAAHGGRSSPAAMEAYQQRAQGLASQEFGQSAARAQAADAATLSALGQQSNIQAGLGQMGYGAQQSLANMAYGAGGQMSNLAAQGGAGLAGLYGGLSAQQMQQAAGQAGLYGQMAGMQQGQGQQLANLGQTYGSNMANLYSQGGAQMASALGGIGTNIANTQMGIGQGMASAVTGGQQMATQLTGPAMQAIGSAVPYQGGTMGAIGQGIAGLGQTLGTAYLANQMYGGGGGGGYNPAGAMDAYGWNMTAGI